MKLASESRYCVVAATPRCGSTLLCATMYKTRRLGRPDEYFNEANTQILHPGACASVTSQIAFANMDGRTDNGVVGIKFMPYQFDRFRREADITRVFPDARWVFVRRDDILAQAISYALAIQTGAWTWSGDPPSAVKYSEEEITGRIFEIVRGEDDWIDFFRKNNIRPLCLYYDAISKSPTRAARRVADFMNVEWPKLPSRLIRAFEDRVRRHPWQFAPMKIQRNEINRDWRRQFTSSTEWPPIRDYLSNRMCGA